MCDASITQDKFSASQKYALVRPILNESNLDPLDLNSYRQISEILEHVIDTRIASHAVRHGLFSTVQSAYHTHHSMETALVKIHSDLIGSVDRGQVGFPYLTCPRHLIPSITGHFLMFFKNVLALPVRHWRGSSRTFLTVHKPFASVVSRPAPTPSVAEYRMARCWALRRLSHTLKSEDIDEIFARHALQHH